MKFVYSPLHTDDDSLRAAAGFLSEVWPKAGFSVDYLRWLYRDNPEGRAIATNALDERGRLVGHYGVVPWRGESPGIGRTVDGALSVNAAVARGARGRGLFVELAERTHAAAAASGKRFVVAAANQHSTHGFTERLGFRRLGGCLDARIGLVPPDRAAGVDRPPDLKRHWTPESLRWRLARPGVRYHAGGGDVPFIYRRWRGLWRVIMRYGEPGAAELVPLKRIFGGPFVFVGRRADLRFPRTRFVDIPRRMRPSPLNLIYRDLSRGEVPLPRTCDFDALDFDAF